MHRPPIRGRQFDPIATPLAQLAPKAPASGNSGLSQNTQTIIYSYGTWINNYGQGRGSEGYPGRGTGTNRHGSHGRRRDSDDSPRIDESMVLDAISQIVWGHIDDTREPSW
jgi:hypothetical protein